MTLSQLLMVKEAVVSPEERCHTEHWYVCSILTYIHQYQFIMQLDLSFWSYPRKSCLDHILVNNLEMKHLHQRS